MNKVKIVKNNSIFEYTYCAINGFPENLKGSSKLAAIAWCFAFDCGRQTKLNF